MFVSEAIQAPPPPPYISWSTIHIHAEYSRGLILDLLNNKLNLIANGNFVGCGTALPEKITDSMRIPDTCFTIYQWALANVDKTFFDYGVPLLCLAAIVAGAIIVKKGMDYVDNVGVLHVDEVALDLAQRRKWVEEAVKEGRFRRTEIGSDIYVRPWPDQIRQQRKLSPEELAAHRAAHTREQQRLENEDRRIAEKKYDIAGDTHFLSPSEPAQATHQEIVSERSWAQRLAGIFTADRGSAVFAGTPRMSHVQFCDFRNVGNESIFEGTIGASSRGDITPDDIDKLGDDLRMTTGIEGPMRVNISKDKKRITITFLDNPRSRELIPPRRNWQTSEICVVPQV
jgi:hypothetical protein